MNPQLQVYRKSLMTMLVNMGVAYGFTLVIWGSGAFCTAFYREMHAVDVIAHIAGAFAVFPLLFIFLFKPQQTSDQLSETRFPVFGFLHLLSIPLALAASYLVCRIIPLSWLGYLLSGFFSVLIYNSGAALELMVMMSAEQKHQLAQSEETGKK